MSILSDKKAVAATCLSFSLLLVTPAPVAAQTPPFTPSLSTLQSLHQTLTTTTTRTLLSFARIFQKQSQFNPHADYRLTTDHFGQAGTTVLKGVYRLTAAAPEGYDLILPQYVVSETTVLNRPNVVYAGLTPGKGRVYTYAPKEVDTKQYAKKRADSLLSAAPASTKVLGATDQAPSNAQTKVKVQLYNDLNQNGRKEPNEPLNRTANVEVAMERADGGVIYSLLNGWNLLHFPITPSTFTTASELITEIAKEGGYVTTVATWVDGQWLEYVQRGGTSYSENDFPIEPGRAYFLRSHMAMDWLVTGTQPQELPEIELQPGWNSVGLFPVNHTASDILDHLNQDGREENATEIDRWFSGSWDTFVKRIYSQDNIREYGNDFSLKNQEGYMIKSDTFTTIQPEEIK